MKDKKHDENKYCFVIVFTLQSQRKYVGAGTKLPYSKIFYLFIYFFMLSIPLCYGKFVIYSFITVKTQHVKVLITGNHYIIQGVSRL
jgi:hypothetical protein